MFDSSRSFGWRFGIVFLLMTVSLPSRGNPQETKESLEKLKAELRATVTNSFGKPIPAFETPSEVVKIAKRAGDLARQAEKEHGVRPLEAQEVVLEALKVLYRGRGNTLSRDGKGWYLANRSGESGQSQIEEILDAGLLDSEGLKSFTKFVSEYDAKSPASKTSVGFPPAFELINDDAREQVMGNIELAQPGKPYKALVVPGNENKVPLVNELLDKAIKEGRISDGQADALRKGILGNLENNLYDESAETKNKGRDFVKYFGRDEERAKVRQAITKLEKGHILMTGKAGVGKTTILKMLSDAFVQGENPIRNEPPPIILELPITTITNQTDPTEIKAMVNQAKALSKALDRRIVLFIDEAHVASDMTMNALKGFLTEINDPQKSRVHMALLTTSGEGRKFLSDTAFSRRFTEVSVPEFNRDQTIDLVKQAHLPRWQRYYQKEGRKLLGISPDAFDYAYKYGKFEQAHAGNPTGTKELLEAAIAKKFYDTKDKGDFTLDVPDVRQYLQDNKGIELFVGDPDFQAKFDTKWQDLNRRSPGNEGFKETLKEVLQGHFQNALTPGRPMKAIAVFGPPGGGKSFTAEQAAQAFFKGAMLTINGAEFKDGGTGTNSKLLGSPTGHVGSEEQRSILTKFFSDHPNGGIIKIEEADYLHQDVIQILTNMITERKVTDGLGKEWDTSQYLLWTNSNIGQDLLINPTAKQKMTWEEYDMKRKALTQKERVGDKEIERVQPARLKDVFDRFIYQIVTKSNPGGDTSEVAQEANKQRRRWTPSYILTPSKDELRAAAKSQLEKYASDAVKDHGVHLNVDPGLIDKLINLDHYEFEKGYSYVTEKLQDGLFNFLNNHMHERGKTINVELKPSEVELNGEKIPSHDLVVNIKGEKTPAVYSLGAISAPSTNPWADNPEMVERILNIVPAMRGVLKGNVRQIQELKESLLAKLTNWNTNVVFTQLGTSGNGKTEFFKAMAKTLYGTPDALFKISGINFEGDWNKYFRSPTGYVGSNKETEFEQWFKSRLNAGGGIILFDEILSFSGLNAHDRGLKINALNTLYDFLDEGFLEIGGKKYDARGFIRGLTGNSLQELFQGLPDDPDAERLKKKILEKVTRGDITDYFRQIGIDPPKVARMGKIFVNGPLSKEDTHAVGELKVKDLVKEIQSNTKEPVQIKIDGEVVQTIVNSLSTNELGMREVDKGLDQLVKEPLSGITKFFPKAKAIEAKVVNGKITWFVGGKEVVRAGAPLDPTGKDTLEDISWMERSKMAASSNDRTPQFKDLPLPKKVQYTPEALETVATHEYYGHWMANTLLNRQNKTSAISLFPGRGYGGYVRHREETEHSLPTLNSLLKEMVALEAGHRAVFLKGRFATGGGTTGTRREEGAPKDDLGRINEIIETIINNNLLPGVSEGSSPQEKQVARNLLRKWITAATDQLLTEGYQSKQFDALYNKLKTEKYLNEEELDEAVKKIDFSSFGNKEEGFVKLLADNLKNTADKSQPKRLQGISHDLAVGTLHRAVSEAKLETNDKAVHAAIDKHLEARVADLLKGHGLDPKTNKGDAISGCGAFAKIAASAEVAQQ